MTLFQRIARTVRVGKLGQNAVFGSVGLGVRAVSQAGYLILLSHWVGPRGYGLFAGSLASVLLVAPLSGWGIAFVLSQRVARDRLTSRSLWATALTQIALTGAILSVAVVLTMGLLLKERLGIGSMALLCLADLIIVPVAQVGTGLCFALGRGLAAACVICLVPVARLLTGVTCMALVTSRTTEVVAMSHFVGSLIGIAGALALIAWIDGPPAWRERLRLPDTLAGGSTYAVGSMFSTSYQEVDKVLMLEKLGAGIVGPYTAAFRVASVFALPMSALMSAALPRLFATNGTEQGPRTLKAVAKTSMTYALVAAIMAAGISPLMPRIFGQGFSEASHYLLMLSPWPIILALHQSAATGLTAFGRQRARLVIEALGMLLIILLNFAFLRSLGAGASVLALLAGEVFMASGCALCLRRK